MQNDYNEDQLREWFNQHSEGYDTRFARSEERYAPDQYRIEIGRDIIDRVKPKRILDIGCGTAVPMLHLLKKGYDVEGFDLSPGMIEQAHKNLKDAGFEPERASVGNILDPATIKKFSERNYDAVVVNGVFPYLKDSDAAHRNIAALIEKGGHYVSSYMNSLFDLFTLNRFTVAFFEGLIKDFDLSTDQRQKVMQSYKALLSRPDEPKWINMSARNDIYSRSDNPLTIFDEIKEYGLNGRDLHFYRFHALPPLLRDADENMLRVFNRISHGMEIKHSRDWRGYVMASGFVVHAIKQ